MTLPAGCPGLEELKQFRSGCLPETQALELQRHFSSCATCLERLPAAAGDDPVVRGLREQRNRPRLNNPLLDRATRDAKTPPVLPSVAASGARVVPASVPTHTPSRTAPRGLSADWRWVIVGGGVLAVLLLIVVIVANTGRLPPGEEPRVGVDPPSPAPPREEFRGVRPFAKPRKPRLADAAGSTGEVRIDPNFAETWVTNPQRLPGVRRWCIESGRVGQYHPTRFGFTRDEQLLVHYLGPNWSSWLELDPATYRLKDGPFQGSYIAISDDGVMCARAAGDAVRLLVVGRAEPLATFPVEEGNPVARFSPDGKIIVTAGTQGRGVTQELHFRDTREGAAISSCAVPGKWFDTSHLTWSPDSAALAVPVEKGIAILREPWKSVDRYVERKMPISGLAWSPDGEVLAVREGDGQVRVIDVADDSKVINIPGHSAATVPAWSPDGKELAFGTNRRRVVVWDRERKAVTYNFAGHTRLLYAVAFLGDGKTLVSGSAGSVRFWDLEKNTPRGVLVMLSPGVSVAVNPEGHYRAAGPAEDMLVFKVRNEKNGLEDLTPLDFRNRYARDNQPDLVRLIGE